MRTVFVSSSFDDLRSADIRFLQEAARRGHVHVLLWSDAAIDRTTGRPPHFEQAERAYVIEAIRYVDALTVVDDALPAGFAQPGDLWAVRQSNDTPALRAACAEQGFELLALSPADLQGFPLPPSTPAPGRKKVIVTGCYDWFHSGHVRFFEEASAYGDLYVAVGNDVNVTNLKGPGHPLFPEDERRYIVSACRYVMQALLTSGMGWMDAAPEIERIRPDIYLVNEDGDKPEKAAFCAERGLEYVVLQRRPKEGLQRRSSTDLRGF